MSSENFDLIRFSKVLKLVYGGATVGERNAARTRAELIAQKAGLTFDQAINLVLSGVMPQTAAVNKPSQKTKHNPKPTKANRDELLKKLRFVIVYGSFELVLFSIFGLWLPLLAYGIFFYSLFFAEVINSDIFAPMIIALIMALLYFPFAAKRIRYIREAAAIRAFLRNYPVSS